MRIVDCFNDVILFARRMARGDSEDITCEDAKKVFATLFIESEKTAVEYELDSGLYKMQNFQL